MRRYLLAGVAAGAMLAGCVPAWAQRIGDLPAATVGNLSDLIPCIQGYTGPGTGVSRKCLAGQLFSSQPVTPTGGTTARTLAAITADVTNVLSFAGVDPTGVTDSSAGINNALATTRNGRLVDVYLPSGVYHLANAITVGSTSASATSQCLIGDGYSTVLDISTDFSISAAGVVIPAAQASQNDVQFCVKNLLMRFHQPPDFTTTTTQAEIVGSTHITVANAAPLAIGYYVADVTTLAAISRTSGAGANPLTTITGISGNTITLSNAVLSPGVGNGDTIAFAQPRANFTTLASGCSLTVGAPGCKYPWAIYNNGKPTAAISNVMIEGAWDGVYQRGQTFFIDHLYVGALDVGLDIDGGHNFPQLDNYELFSFGFNSSVNTNQFALANVYYDTNTICANLGATDGLAAGKVQCWQGKLNLTANWSWGHFASIMMDGTNSDFSFASSAGWAQIANFYSTKGDDRGTPIQVSSGKVYIGNIRTSSAPSKLTGSGTISVTGGDLHIYGGNLFAGETSAIPDSSVSGGLLEIVNTTFDVGSGCGNLGSAGYFSQSGTGVLQLNNDKFTTSCVATRTGVKLTTDVLGSQVRNMLWNGWTLSGPTSFATGPLGVYAPNPILGARAIASGSSDTQKLTDQNILWKSASGAAKAQSIFGCSSNNFNQTLTVADAFGDANTNPITITPQGGTINGAASFAMARARGAVTLICGAGTDWFAQ